MNMFMSTANKYELSSIEGFYILLKSFTAFSTFLAKLLVYLEFIHDDCTGQLETVEMEARNGKWKWKTEIIKT